MTRLEAEDLAREDARAGIESPVPEYAAEWYQAARDEEIDHVLRERRADLRRRGIVAPWWELYRSRP